MDAQKSSYCINVIKTARLCLKYALNNLVVFFGGLYGTNIISI